MMNFKVHEIRGMRGVVLSLGMVTLAVANQASASDGAQCLLNDGKKVCVNVDALPGDEVQRSGMEDPNNPGQYFPDTYLLERFQLQNFDTPQSTRRFEMSLNYPASTEVVALVRFEGSPLDPASHCTKSGNTVNCVWDKLDASGAPAQFGVRVRTPTTVGPFETSYVAGWQGNTMTSSHTYQATNTGAATYFEAGQTKVLLSDVEAADPQDRTSPESPIWTKATLPPQQSSGTAVLSIDSDGPSRADACLNDAYVGVDGAYICRDNQNVRRWTGLQIAGDLSNPLIEFEIVWNSTIMSSLQLDPSDLLPTGTPPVGIFYQFDDEGDGTSSGIRAFGDQCDAASAPCVKWVEKLANGDWHASFLINYGDASTSILPPVAGLLKSSSRTVSKFGFGLERWKDVLNAQRQTRYQSKGLGDITVVEAVPNPPTPDSILRLN